MAKVVTLTIGLDPDTQQAIALSLANLAGMVALLDADRFSKLIERLGVTGDDLGDLLRCEAVELSASVANKLNGLKIEAGNGYLKLFAALAGDGNADAILVRHGWPILSLGCCSTSVAEAGHACDVPGGCLAPTERIEGAVDGSSTAPTPKMALSRYSLAPSLTGPTRHPTQDAEHG